MTVLHTPRRRARHWAVIRPGWVPSWASVAFDFANNRSYGDEWRGRLTCVRSSTTDYADNLAGVWFPFPANAPRITNKGMLIEKAATNVVIQNRDLTQAAWVAVSVTPAKDQVGIDGVANSASSITATGANGTILQTDVLGSSSRLASAFVKRITGSGTIQFTGDGAAYSTITVTTEWTRVKLAAATVVNPVTGFKIVTSGDAIAVDFVQNETAVAQTATSPILTAAVAVTRSIDSILMSPLLPAWFNPLEGTIFAQAVIPQVSATNAQVLVCFDDNSGNNRMAVRENSAAVGGCIWTSGGVTQANVAGGTLTAGSISKVCAAYQSNSFISGGAGSLGTLDTAGTVPTITQLRFGDNTGAPLNGYLQRFAYGPRRVPDNEVARITTPSVWGTPDAP